MSSALVYTSDSSLICVPGYASTTRRPQAREDIFAPDFIGELHTDAAAVALFISRTLPGIARHMLHPTRHTWRAQVPCSSDPGRSLR